MLHHSGMKPFSFSLDGLAVKSKAGVVNSPGTRHNPAHAGDGEAPLPAVLSIISGAFEQQFDGGVARSAAPPAHPGSGSTLQNQNK